MTGSARWAGCAALLLLACQRNGPPIGPLPHTLEDQAVLLVGISDDHKVGFARNLDDPSGLPALVAREDQLLLAVLYPLRLPALGLNSGPLLVVTDGGGDPIPNFETAQALDLAAGSWRSASEPELKKLRDLRIRFDLAQCDCARAHDTTQGECVACRPALQIEAPTPPEPPLPPMLRPCPTGWQEAGVEEDEQYCQPAPYQACAPGQTRRLFEESCQPLGPACPSGAFGSAPASARYVDPAAQAGGNGTLLTPFDTLQAAITAASAGDTIVLAKGEILEPVTINKPLTIEGACVAETVMRSPSLIRVRAPNVSLRNLSVEDHGLVVDMGGGLSLQAVALQNLGRAIESAEPLMLSDVVIRDVDEEGIVARADLEIATLLIDGARVGISLDPGVTLNARDLWIRRTAMRGVFAERATIDADRLVIEESADIGLEARSSTTTVDHALFRGGSHGMFVVFGHATVLHSAFFGSRRHNLLSDQATFTLSDLISSDAGLHGVEGVVLGMDIRRARFARNGNYCINMYVISEPSTAQDLICSGPALPVAEGLVYFGNDQSGMHMQRALVKNTGLVGVVLAGPATFSDITVLNVRRAGIPLAGGVGIELRAQYPYQGQRIAVEDAASTGLLVWHGSDEACDDTTLSFSDVRTKRGEVGVSFQCPRGLLSKVLIENSSDQGLDLGESWPVLRVEATDVLLSHVAEGATARGAVVVDQGTLRLDRARAEHVGTGLLLALEGRVEPVAFEISDARIGLDLPLSYEYISELTPILLRDTEQAVVPMGD